MHYLINRTIYIYILTIFIFAFATFIAACNNTKTDITTDITTDNDSEKAYPIALPRNLLTFHDASDGILEAYASIDNRAFLPMNLLENSAEFVFNDLPTGQHTLHLKFDFISNKYTKADSSPKTFQIAYADIPITLTDGVNRISIADTDIKYDIDTDLDKIDNIKELRGGSDPGDSPDSPTILSSDKIYVSQFTFEPLLDINVIDPNDDMISLTIGGPWWPMFTLSNASPPALSIKSSFSDDTIWDHYDLTISASDSVNDSIQKINYSIVHYFSANDANNGFELWRSDGTALGTKLVKNINKSGHSSPEQITPMKNIIYFSAYNKIIGRELWKSDGSIKNTTFIKDINLSGNSSPSNLFVLGDWLYFSAFDGSKTSLWRTKANTDTDTNTENVLYNNGEPILHPTSLTSLNGNLYFSAYQNSSLSKRILWRTDPNTNLAVATSIPLSNGTEFYNPEKLTASNGNLFFVAHATSSSKNVLWKLDGTSMQTSIVRDFNGYGISSAKMFDWNRTLYFAASEGNKGIELWSSDGTTLGSNLLFDLHQSSGTASGSSYHSFPYNFTSVNHVTYGNRLYYSARNPSVSNLTALWRLREGSTAPVAIDTSIASNPQNLVSSNGYLYFSAWNDFAGRAFSHDDGTTATFRVLTGFEEMDPRAIIQVNNSIYLSALSEVGRELWKMNTISPLTTKPEIVTDIDRLNSNSLQDVKGMLVMYDFNEAEGNTVYDISTSSAPSSLLIDNQENINWVTGGLKIIKPTILHSTGSFTKAITPIKYAEAISVELWLSSATIDKSTSTVLSISNSVTDRNFVLQQFSSAGVNSVNYQAQLRTSETYADGEHLLPSPKAVTTTVQQQLVHLVYTRTNKGKVVYYINGKATTSPNISQSGSLATWSDDMPLILGASNENMEAWLGTFYRLAIYNCALTPTQISSNFQNGSEGKMINPVGCL